MKKSGALPYNSFMFSHVCIEFLSYNIRMLMKIIVPFLGNEDGDDEDEFYECDEDVEEDEKPNGSRSSWDKPEGRIKRCAKLRLLKTNEPLYIPFTQEPAPMTEDRLEEHAGVLLRLGTDALGSQLRARMMSASLLSDMESFKVHTFHIIKLIFLI